MFNYVGVGIDAYEHPDFGVLAAVDEVTRIAELLSGKGFAVDTMVNVSDGEASMPRTSIPRGRPLPGWAIRLQVRRGRRPG